MSRLVERASRLAIINAAGFSTRVGGSCPAPEVLEAMAFAQSAYFEIDDLLLLASEIIGEATGSESGLVTCGAGAALALAAAAVLAGMDVEVMDRLPDTTGLKRVEFLYPTRGPFDYDHPIRQSGAILKEVSFEPENLEARLVSALGVATAGIVFVWNHRDDEVVVRRVAAVCRQHGLPLILDAAMALPPAENLRKLARMGANLVALSGGKHLGGPQNSGLLFGDRELVESARLQMVDMDVRPDSWSCRGMIRQGIVPRPPRHGIGRAMKIGKDTILGCLTALGSYPSRDFASERARWWSTCERIVADARLPEHFSLRALAENSTGQYPVVEMKAEEAARMERLKDWLKTRPRKIILAEHETDPATAFLYPLCLREEDIPEITEALTQFPG